MSKDIEVLAQFFAAINRNDMPAMAAHFHPDIVRIEPPGFPTAGTYRGIAQVQAHVAQGRGTWAEGSCETEKFLSHAGKVVVYLHAHVRLHGSSDWMGGRFADGFMLRDGRITDYISFAERADALRWAGIEEGTE